MAKATGGGDFMALLQKGAHEAAEKEKQKKAAKEKAALEKAEAQRVAAEKAAQALEEAEAAGAGEQPADEGPKAAEVEAAPTPGLAPAGDMPGGAAEGPPVPVGAPAGQDSALCGEGAGAAVAPAQPPWQSSSGVAGVVALPFQPPTPTGKPAFCAPVSGGAGFLKCIGVLDASEDVENEFTCGKCKEACPTADRHADAGVLKKATDNCKKCENRYRSLMKRWKKLPGLKK